MTIKNLLFTMIGAVLLLSVACTPPPTAPTIDHAAIKEAIAANTQAWAKAINAKDIEAQMALFAENINVYPPNKTPDIGIAAVRKSVADEIANDTTVWSIAFTTNDVYAGGDYATEIGSWVVSGPDGTVYDKGNYTTVFEKKDDKYVVIRDIFNSEMPVPTPDPLPGVEEEEE